MDPQQSGHLQFFGDKKPNLGIGPHSVRLQSCFKTRCHGYRSRICLCSWFGWDLHEVLLSELPDFSEIRAVNFYRRIEWLVFIRYIWVIDGTEDFDEILVNDFCYILSTREETLQLDNKTLSVFSWVSANQSCEKHVLIVNRTHSKRLLSDAEYFLEQVKVQLFFVLNIHLSIQVLLDIWPIRSVVVGDASWRLSQLHWC